MSPDIRLQEIEERNRRVEADKAWETSWARRGLIALITYVCAVILLSILGNAAAWAGAFVPVMGYILSTLTLPAAKTAWLKRNR